MKTFRPMAVPTKPEDLPAFIDRMQVAIQQAAARSDSYTALQYLGALPARPKDGLYLFGAGVAGTNRGAYRYDSLSGTYTFVA